MDGVNDWMLASISFSFPHLTLLCHGVADHHADEAYPPCERVFAALPKNASDPEGPVCVRAIA